jgi:hypothetical protein
VLGWSALVWNWFLVRKMNVLRGCVVAELDFFVDEDGRNGVKSGLEDHENLKRVEVKY